MAIVGKKICSGLISINGKTRTVPVIAGYVADGSVSSLTLLVPGVGMSHVAVIIDYSSVVDAVLSGREEEK